MTGIQVLVGVFTVLFIIAAATWGAVRNIRKELAEHRGFILRLQKVTGEVLKDQSKINLMIKCMAEADRNRRRE